MPAATAPHPVTRPLLFVFFLLLTSLLTTNTWAQSYRILVTNDDGVDSPLLAILVDELKTLGEVVVSAPRTNQSGSSQATTGGRLKVERILREGQLFGYGVLGTPADALRYGLLVLGKDDPFDLVVSGINNGANVGKVSHMSGTVGAAMQAVYLGIPAIAVSQDTSGVDTLVTAKLAAQLVRRYQTDGAPEGAVVSINVPRGVLKGVAIRPMGDAYLGQGQYELIGETPEALEYERTRSIDQSQNESSDTWAYQNGYATVTPLQLDWTDYTLLQQLPGWQLTLP
jgi:5'-nucleotidase